MLLSRQVRAIKCNQPCTWRPNNSGGKRISLINDNRLHVTDIISGKIFLVDTGAECSILTRQDYPNFIPTLGDDLRAANGTTIPTCGQCKLTIDFRLNHTFIWNFYVTDLPYNLIGADFLRRYHLLPDLTNEKHVECSDTLNATSLPDSTHNPIIAEIHCDNPIQLLIDRS